VASTAGSPRPAPTAEEWREKGCCGCVFKDLSCGYRGRATWCDHTEARCAEIGNISRYDGSQPDLRDPWRPHLLDVLFGLLTLLCYWYSWPWKVAVPVYTASCSFFIPHVRHEVILWWTLHVQPLRRHFVRRDWDPNADLDSDSELQD